MRRVVMLGPLFILCLLGVCFGQTSDVRTERLIGLARVWNTVKYYHPYLADRKIDWDKALVETIPKINAAQTDAEYAAAVNAMLAVLDDPVTKAETEPPAPDKYELHRATQPVTSVNGVIRIDLGPAANALFDRAFKSQMILPAIEALLPNAKGVIIDAREPGRGSMDEDSSYLVERSLYLILPVLLAENVNTDRATYRTHDGYAPQAGSTSGGYHSSVLSEAPKFIPGNAKKAVPITFIVNHESFDQLEVWNALQQRHLASVIYEGDKLPDLGVVTAPIELPGKITARIRTIEVTSDSGPVTFRPDITVKADPSDTTMQRALASAASPVFGQTIPANVHTAAQSDLEDPYSSMAYPSAEYRLLALFRFWGVIDTFYPYKELIAETWRTVLPRLIPRFENAKTAVEYQRAVYELVTEIHDSHGFIRGADAFDEDYGTFLPPLLVRPVGGKMVVGNVMDDKASVKAGDIIEQVDGRSVSELTESMRSILVASTPQAFARAVADSLLRGKKDSVLHLVLRRGGQALTVDVARTLFRFDPKVFAAEERTTSKFDVLPSGYGYVDLARLTNADVNDMFKKIASTKAVIFDMRGYPNGTAWSIAPRLTKKDQPEAALFSRPMVSGMTLTDPDRAASRLTFRQRLPVAHGDRYDGKVVMLIDDTSISQAEHTCLFFETTTDVTFIGTPTVGANGDVTNTVLPGGIYVYFTGQSVQHIDGRQLQRLGIQPTISVEPTLAGVTAGRDEVLEAAIKYLKRNVK